MMQDWPFNTSRYANPKVPKDSKPPQRDISSIHYPVYKVGLTLTHLRGLLLFSLLNKLKCVKATRWLYPIHKISWEKPGGDQQSEDLRKKLAAWGWRDWAQASSNLSPAFPAQMLSRLLSRLLLSSPAGMPPAIFLIAFHCLASCIGSCPQLLFPLSFC
jgi:hypothetical protein